MELIVSMSGSLASTSNSTCLQLRPTICRSKKPRSSLVVRAIKAPEECNEEECAPTKEVGSLSMEWKAEDNTKVVGTFPPIGKQNRFTGYVEKDSAGQANIYAVEPPVYVGESAVSTGSAGASSEGSQLTLGIIAGLGLATAAAAALIISKEPESGSSKFTQPDQYSGPPLSYYIDKFEPPKIQVQSLITTPESPSEQAPSVVVDQDET